MPDSARTHVLGDCGEACTTPFTLDTLLAHETSYLTTMHTSLNQSACVVSCLQQLNCTGYLMHQLMPPACEMYFSGNAYSANNLSGAALPQDSVIVLNFTCGYIDDAYYIPALAITGAVVIGYPSLPYIMYNLSLVEDTCTSTAVVSAALRVTGSRVRVGIMTMSRQIVTPVVAKQTTPVISIVVAAIATASASVLVLVFVYFG